MQGHGKPEVSTQPQKAKPSQTSEDKKRLRMAILGQLIKKKKQDQVRNQLGELEALYPDLRKGLLHNQMGCAFSQAGRNDKAEQHLLKAEKLVSPYIQFSNVYMNLGNLEAQKRNYNAAIEQYEKVIANSPYYLQRACEKGFQDLRYLGKFNSHDAYVDAYTNLSVMYANNGQPERGFSYCQKAIQLSPESMEANINYGDILRQIGRKEEAIDHTWAQIVKLTTKKEESYQRNSWIEIAPAHEVPGDNQDKFINVLCVKWGKRYGADYVNKLYKGIQRNTSWKFRFFCFTDDSANLHPSIQPMALQQGWTGWWGKVTLFKDYPEIVGKKFYIDLDMIVTGNLDQIFGYQGEFGTLTTDGIACEKQHKSGYNSSIMIWKNHKLTTVYSALKGNFANIRKFIVRFDFWLEMNIKNADFLQDLYKGQISDFLESCQKEVPLDTRIVCFPRRPKPDSYPAEWIKDYWVE